MKPVASRHSRHSALLLAVAFGLALAGAGTAQAFTFEDQNAGSARAGQNFVDLDAKAPRTDLPASRFDSGGRTVTQGNATFHFGGASGGSFDQRYNPSNLFDPYARDGR